jgi:hypothetical protein
MSSHRYAIGQTVYLTPNRFDRSSARKGRFRVTGLLPESQGDYQYRIKSASDAHERVAPESELQKITDFA